MRSSSYQYIDHKNQSWRLVEDMWAGIEAHKSQAKFKRVAMLHYLHCIDKKIQAAII